MNEIPQTIGRHLITVSINISAYKEGYITGLVLGHSTGKPPKLSEEQKAVLLETVSTKVPADVGFTVRYNWTLSLAAQFVKKEWDISAIVYVGCQVFYTYLTSAVPVPHIH